MTHQMDFPDDSCSNKGLLHEGHRQLARQYERETDAGVDESIAATQGQYWNEPHYYVYLMTPKYYTELDGKKYPFTGKLNKPRVIILTK